jgi:hypothetical protein
MHQSRDAVKITIGNGPVSDRICLRFLNCLFKIPVDCGVCRPRAVKILQYIRSRRDNFFIHKKIKSLSS